MHKLFWILLLTCNVYLTASAPNPNPTIGGAVIGFGVSPVAGYNDYYGYSGYPGYGYGIGNGYRRKYRYPHFYPPIAVLAG